MRPFHYFNRVACCHTVGVSVSVFASRYSVFFFFFISLLVRRFICPCGSTLAHIYFSFCPFPPRYLYCICILFLLYPIDNTLVVQYQVVQGCLNYVYIIKKRKLEWRRAHYSKTNYGPLTRLTLFNYSFVIH